VGQSNLLKGVKAGTDDQEGGAVPAPSFRKTRAKIIDKIAILFLWPARRKKEVKAIPWIRGDVRLQGMFAAWRLSAYRRNPIKQVLLNHGLSDPSKKMPGQDGFYVSMSSAILTISFVLIS